MNLYDIVLPFRWTWITKRVKMDDKHGEIFSVASDDGMTSRATISQGNVIEYKLLPGGRIKIAYKIRSFPHQNLERAELEANITPHNTHILRNLQRWGVRQTRG
jgi:hypothetical protein